MKGGKIAMGKKVIYLCEEVEKSLEVEVIKEKHRMRLLGKKGYLNLYLYSKFGFHFSKSKKEKVTKEQAKKIILDVLTEVVLDDEADESSMKMEMWEKKKSSIWREIEENIVTKKAFHYEILIGECNNSNRGDFFSDWRKYAMSHIFVIK